MAEEDFVKSFTISSDCDYSNIYNRYDAVGRAFHNKVNGETKDISTPSKAAPAEANI